jgi:hypothetical protein
LWSNVRPLTDPARSGYTHRVNFVKKGTISAGSPSSPAAPDRPTFGIPFTP